MAYIKIYDNKLMPIGVVDVDSFSAIEGGERYVKIKDENGAVIGAVNIDGDVSINDVTRFVTTFGDNLLPTGVKDVTEINYSSYAQIGDYDNDSEGGEGGVEG